MCVPFASCELVITISWSRVHQWMEHSIRVKHYWTSEWHWHSRP